MGQATRTTKLSLSLDKRDQGGANSEKRALLDATVQVLTQARAFYIDFFLAHADKLAERVAYYSEKHSEMRERGINANELLTWAEACSVATTEHPHPWPGWDFTEAFPGRPVCTAAVSSRMPSVLFPLRSPRGEVLLAGWQAHSGEVGQPVLLSGVSV